MISTVSSRADTPSSQGSAVPHGFDVSSNVQAQLTSVR